MMPELLFSNSMATTGKVESLRFAKIDMPVVVEVASAAASAVAVDSEVALVAVVALAVAAVLADEEGSGDQAAMVEEVALVAAVVTMAAASTLPLPLHPGLLTPSPTTLPLVVTRAL